MKKFTRVLAPVLALSLAASLFTGCGSKAEETQAAAAETQAAAAEKKEEAKAAPKVSASMKKEELLAVAEELGIKVPAKATKADIIAAIEAK